MGAWCWAVPHGDQVSRPMEDAFWEASRGWRSLWGPSHLVVGDKGDFETQQGMARCKTTFLKAGLGSPRLQVVGEKGDFNGR